MTPPPRKTMRVSIHALLAECDYAAFHQGLIHICFNPRTPCGVRPIPAWRHPALHSVSIHALLAECDQWTMATSRRPTSFNPRTPCGVRLRGSICLSVEFQFQSTHSLRSATDNPGTIKPLKEVSIHALLAECDIQNKKLVDNLASFNPRTPCGVRRAEIALLYLSFKFQSTHSLRSATEIKQ